jgi:hypothetical protein
MIPGQVNTAPKAVLQLSTKDLHAPRKSSRIYSRPREYRTQSSAAVIN